MLRRPAPAQRGGAAARVVLRAYPGDSVLPLLARGHAYVCALHSRAGACRQQIRHAAAALHSRRHRLRPCSTDSPESARHNPSCCMAILEARHHLVCAAAKLQPVSNGPNAGAAPGASAGAAHKRCAHRPKLRTKLWQMSKWQQQCCMCTPTTALPSSVPNPKAGALAMGPASLRKQLPTGGRAVPGHVASPRRPKCQPGAATVDL